MFAERDIQTPENPIPDKDRYIVVRAIKNLTNLCGERGRAVMAWYNWARWVDNTIDEGGGTSEGKIAFLERQGKLINGKTRYSPLLQPEERAIFTVCWKGIPQEQVIAQANVLLSSMRTDVEATGLVPRQDREIRHYNWQTLHPPIEMLCLILNGKSMRAGLGFMKVLDALVTIGSIEGLVEDMRLGVCKIGFGFTDRQNIAAVPPNERTNKILNVYSPNLLKEEVEQLIEIVRSNLSSTWKLDIPFWQKTLATFYFGVILPLAHNPSQYPCETIGGGSIT